MVEGSSTLQYQSVLQLGGGRGLNQFLLGTSKAAPYSGPSREDVIRARVFVLLSGMFVRGEKTPVLLKRGAHS